MAASVSASQPELPFDDYSLTAVQLEDIKNEQSRIITPVLNGEKTGLYKAFKDFDEKGVFDIVGSRVDMTNDGRLSETGWRQLRAATEIYRSKKFETFRYILVDRNGTITDQLALTSYLPNICQASVPNDETWKKIISRAHDLDCMIVACHNHPSGNTEPSKADIDTTNELYRSFTSTNGNTKFLGHIILDHNTFSYAIPDSFSKKCEWQTADYTTDGSLDRFVIPDSPDFMYSHITPATLLSVASQINDNYAWSDNYVPVIFTNNDFNVNALQYFSRDFFQNESNALLSELRRSAVDSGSIFAFPVVTESLWNRISGRERAETESLFLNHIKSGVFADVAIIEDSYYGFSVCDKYGINSSEKKTFFTDKDAVERGSEIASTWEPYINRNIFLKREDEVEKQVAAGEEQPHYENKGVYMIENKNLAQDFPFAMDEWTLMSGEKPAEIPPERFVSFLSSFHSTFGSIVKYADKEEKKYLEGTLTELEGSYFAFRHGTDFQRDNKHFDAVEHFRTCLMWHDSYSRFVAANHWNHNTEQFSPDTHNYLGGFSEYILSKSARSPAENITAPIDDRELVSQFDREISDWNVLLYKYNKKYPGKIDINSVEPPSAEWYDYTQNFNIALRRYFADGTRPENDRFIIGKTPLVLQKTGSDLTEVTVPVSVVKKAKELHGLTVNDISESLFRLYNPILVFDSDKKASENKNDSKLILTDVFKERNPIAVAVNVNSEAKLKNSNISVEVQDIRSIHDRTVIAKNGTDLIKKWAEEGLCRYVDDKKITDWSSLARVYFPVELLQSDNNNVLKKSSLVNVAETQFDRELSDFIDGKLSKDHVFNLGEPGVILQKCGFPEGRRIEMSASHILLKSNLKRHPFDLSEIKGLDNALQEPVAVFSYGDRAKSQNVVVSIEHEGKNFLAGIHFNQSKRGYEVSDVRTLFPKDNHEWINWINQGKMIYGDKEKLQALIAQQRMNVAEVSGQVVQSPLYERCLESADNILQKFGDVKDIFTDGSKFYADIKEKADIEQKFYGYYTEKGNLDARDIAENEAAEFYTALKTGDSDKIREYTESDEYHEIYELAREIYNAANPSRKQGEIAKDNRHESPETIVVDGNTVELKGGLEEGFKNAYRRLEKVLDANESLAKENEKLRKELSKSVSMK